MKLHGFRKSEDGVAAVEFALLLPVLITLFFGVVEGTLALLCRADVSIMASTAADLISQESSTTKADIQNVYDASGTILYPFYTGGGDASTRPAIRLTSVTYDTSTKSTTSGKVAWTCVQTGKGTVPTRAKNDTVTFPSSQALMNTDGSVIIAEVAYNYATPTTKVITGDISMANAFYTKPRRVAQIPAPTDGCP